LIENLHHIKQISCGGWHSLILNEEGQVFSFGNNNSGELGLGHKNGQNIPQIIPRLFLNLFLTVSILKKENI
jgi:alpha-tubulin suppressor-like RCC1 family protein